MARPSKAVYNFNGWKGCVTIVHSKQGPYVAVYKNDQADIETINGAYKWSAVCMEHEETVLCETLHIARASTADPLEWCPKCEKQKEVAVW